MMFKNKYLCFLLFSLSIYCTACKKWLDVNPKTQVSEKVLFENEQGFKDALIGVYTQMGARSSYGKEFTMAFMDVLAQNYRVSVTTSTYYQSGRYNYVDAATKSIIDGFWVSSYKAIADLNNLLEQIENKRSVFSSNNYQIIKGEALALRAFLHFDLLRAFGPIPVGNLETPAIPYTKVFNMDLKAKLSFRQVTNECLNDLTEAVNLLAIDKGLYMGTADAFRSFTRNHMNYWAATGLMARIYLYKGDNQNAYKKAKEVIDEKIFQFITTAGINTTASPDRTFSSEHLFGLYVANLLDINAELFKQIANASVLTNTAAFINSRFEVAAGGSTDYRNLYLWKTDGATATKYPIKYWSDDLSFSGNVIKRIPLIRFSEMYYIAAEASSNLTEKIDLLNEVRTHRGLPVLAQNLSATAIETEIFKEYKKEFYQEGQLFYYYKRLNKTQIEGFGTPVGAAVYVLPVPNDEIEFNRP